MRKIRNVLLLIVLLLSFTSYAWADVTTFGFSPERTRGAEGVEPVLWPAWEDKSGVSYSQPLILKGWGEYEGKTLVVAVTKNYLRGYECILPDNSGDYQPLIPLWNIPLRGGKPTKSHPTLVDNKNNGKKYIYIGTDVDASSKTGHLEIIDITNFNNPSKAFTFEDRWSSDIVSAPLIVNWNGHELVIYTAGNTAEIHIASDPMDKKKANNLRISLGSGRTSSSPGPLFLDPKTGEYTGFIVGLDKGQNSGEFKIFKLDDILAEKDDKVIIKSNKPYLEKKLPSGLVASFSVDTDKKEVIFGDSQSRVYSLNYETGTRWVNDQFKGIFSNRSPAITKNTVYFPAVGLGPNSPGKLLSINRSTHQANWSNTFSHKAQTAPLVWIVKSSKGSGAAVLEGVGNGYLALINPSTGVKFAAIPIATAKNPEAYGSGVSGELSASDNWVVATSEEGVKAWYAQPMDFEVASLDPGCPKKGENYIAEPGQKYTATAVINFKQKDFQYPYGIAMPLAAFNELGSNAYVAKLKYPDGKELDPDPEIPQQQIHYFKDQGEQLTVKWDWTAGNSVEQYVSCGINIDYPQPNKILNNIFPEVTLDNNIKRVPITINGYDVSAKIKPLKTKYMIPGSKASVLNTVKITRKDGNPGAIPVKVTISGTAGNSVTVYNLNPGDVKTISVKASLGPGTYKIRVEAWAPSGEWTDILPNDNVDELTFTVQKMDLPAAGSGIRVGL